MPYTPNVLNEYSNYTYRIRIFMLPPLMARYGEYQNSGIMIADTASDARYNVQSMEQINHLDFSIARNSLANNLTIRIAETNGITLYETLAAAAAQLDVRNYISNAKYVIEVSFPGRQQDGTSIGVSGPYVIPVIFSRLDANITSTGTMYDITAVEVSTNASSYVLGTLRETVAFTATTVGEAIVEFQNVINEQEAASLLSNPNALTRNTYAIQFDENAREWADWQIEFDEETPGADDVNGTRQFQVIAGTSFNEFFTRILTNTREFKSYPVITGGYAAPNPDGPADNFDLKVFYKVISNETYRQFDRIAGTYAKDVTFFIKKYITPNLTVSADEVIEYLRNENIQRLRVQHLLGLGLLKKRYDYLYTGKNTEVINLDIKLENTFYMVAPSMGGQVYSARLANKLEPSANRIETRRNTGNNPGNPNASGYFGGGLRGSPPVAEEPNTGVITPNTGNNPGNPNASGYFGGDQLGTETPQETSGPVPDGQLAYEERLAEQNAFSSNISEQERLEAAQSSNALLARDANGNLIETNPTIRRLLEERFQAREQQVSENISTSDMRYIYLRDGVDQTYINAPLNDTTTSSVMRFGASLQNLYTSGDMLEIEIHVRGDPYWIGQPRSVYGFSTLENAADFELGSPYFFLNINLPSENGPSKEYMITGLYRVISVISEYRNGKFVQYLKAQREAIINTRTVIAALESGEGIMPNIAPNAPLDGTAGGNGGRVGATGQNGPTGNQGDGIYGDEQLPEYTPPDGFEGNHEISSGNDELNRILAETGDQTGVRVVTTSGYRGPGGSGRHNGYASDVALYAPDGRRLNISNPEDSAIIREFSQNFYDNATGLGYNANIGVGYNGPGAVYGTGSNNPVYMHGQSFHYDIAPWSNTYWGNNEIGGTGRVPPWLPEIYNN